LTEKGENMPRALSVEVIATRILFIRGQRVMLDKDLARLYGVPVRVLNQAVKRNIGRFPRDFMYQLTKQEVIALRSQIATLNTQPYIAQEDINLKSQNVISSSELPNNQEVIERDPGMETSSHGGGR
jgi:hypothetical protein